MMTILADTVAALMSLPATAELPMPTDAPGTLKIIHRRVPMSLREITLPDGTVVTLH
jgi:hypothetical protein